ncbi:hypothetical protein TWF696_007964 [Orbilia brochopaga]|uniref:Rhodopsin domain-containing protein n=1 Tax=Orbilia brochopaga TaxID=3140254 RepID=A0AAV9UQF1_9PEZI
MSNSSEAIVLTSDDVYAVLNVALWIGVGSPNYYNISTMDVMQKYADWVIETNCTGITPEEITKRFGTKPEDASRLIGEGIPSVNALCAATTTIAYQWRDYLPHPTNTDVVVPLYATFTALTAIVMALRLWSRYKIAGGIRSFDWLAIAGFFLTVVWGAIAVYHSVASTHLQAYYDMSWDQIRNSRRVRALPIKYTFMIAELTLQRRKAYKILVMFYPWVMMVIKFSLLIFYYRMTKWNYIHWSVWATTFIVIANTVSAFVLYIVQYPHIDNWNHPFEHERVERRTIQIATSAVYIATDVIIWVMPMPLVFQLKLYPRERILALFTFSLGAVACVASCIRLDSILKYDSFSPQSSSSLLVDAWTIVELYLTLLCASAPAIRALAIHYAPKVLNSVGSAAFSTAATTSTTIAKKTGSATSNTSVNTGSAQKQDVKTTVTSELDDIEKEVEKEFRQAEREAAREAQKEAERQAQEEAEKEAKNGVENLA